MSEEAANPLMDPAVAENVLLWPGALNTSFVLTSAYLVWMMQAGFCLLTVGSVRARSAKSVCVKSFCDAVLGGCAWYLFGYAFAYGDPVNEDGTVGGNGFIGSQQFALSGTSQSMLYNFLFQYMFAISTATIVSGAVAERLRFEAYCLYAVFLTAWVYPVVAHWVWSPAGWASPLRSSSVGSMFLGYAWYQHLAVPILWAVQTGRSTGVYDTVGSGAVHMLAGVAAFWGALITGPRIGRFDANGKPLEMGGHNMVFYVIGVVLLWFGWYGFNPGTMYYIIGYTAPYPPLTDIVSRAAVNTTLGGCFGGTIGLLVGFLWHLGTNKTINYDLDAIGGGALTGMVVVTSGCAFLQPWAAVVGGIVGGILYLPSCKFVLHILKVDDPCNAFVIHAVGGAMGVIWPSLFAVEDFVHAFYGSTTANGSARAFGWWMGGGSGGAKLLAAAVIWVLVVAGWTTAMMAPFFFVLKLCKILRVPQSEEMLGLDASKHGGSAYNMDATLGGSYKGDGDKSLQAQLAALQDRVLMLEGGKASV